MRLRTALATIAIAVILISSFLLSIAVSGTLKAVMFCLHMFYLGLKGYVDINAVDTAITNFNSTIWKYALLGAFSLAMLIIGILTFIASLTTRDEYVYP